MCRLQNIAMRDYQESVTTRQTHTQKNGRTDGQTDARHSDPHVPLCFAGNTKTVPHHAYKTVKCNLNYYPSRRFISI